MTFLSAVDGDEYRDPELINLERLRYLGVLSSKWKTYTISVILRDHLTEGNIKNEYPKIVDICNETICLM